MLDKIDLEKIKEIIETFFQKSTFPTQQIDILFNSSKKDVKKDGEIINDAIELNIKIEEPQILIGEKGQTLFEIQHLLKIILNKKLQKIFYLNFDINNYKKKKIERLKSLANELADEVFLTKEEKVLLPMSSYERRIVHAELTNRSDVFTESCGSGTDRHVVIKPQK